jgi:CheY-like chemotaxis protein
MLKSLARLLRQLGYESLLFPSAEAFANHRGFENAACVLLDINLGDVSGIELRHRLRAADISVPVIYMTGNDNPSTRKAAHQSGCLAYLTKPFSAACISGREATAGAAANMRTDDSARSRLGTISILLCDSATAHPPHGSRVAKRGPCSLRAVDSLKAWGLSSLLFVRAVSRHRTGMTRRRLLPSRPVHPGSGQKRCTAPAS